MFAECMKWFVMYLVRCHDVIKVLLGDFRVIADAFGGFSDVIVPNRDGFRPIGGNSLWDIVFSSVWCFSSVLSLLIQVKVQW